MIVPINTPELMRATIYTFGRLPTEFAFGNCAAWLEISTEYNPIAVLTRRGMDVNMIASGWLFYYKGKCCNNELTQLLRPYLDSFNVNPCYVSVHYYEKIK